MATFNIAQYAREIAQIRARRKREMLRMRESGLSMAEIGRRLGISRQAVHQALRASGKAKA